MISAILHATMQVSAVLRIFVILSCFVALVSGCCLAEDGPEQVYRLRLYHTHTNEHLDVVYREGNTYLPGSIHQLEHFLRDHRTGAVHHFDPRLFDVLHDLMAAAGEPDAE